jgi:hypothetical protein
LENVRDTYYEEFPESISIDAEGNLSIPKVIERRMYVGFHNGYDFVQSPTIVNLQHTIDEDGQGSDLIFLGNVRLDDLQDRGISLIFSVEYKVLVTVKGSQEQEKGGLSGLVERLSNGLKTKQSERSVYGMEKVVIVGWGCLDPESCIGLF